MRALSLSVAGLTFALAGNAFGQAFTNPDFETGDLTGWNVANTPNGVGAPGSVTVVDIDGPGPLTDSLAARFQVGNAVSTPGNQAGVEMTQVLSLQGGTGYTFEFDWAALNSAATGSNAEGGVFSLIVDGVIQSSMAAGSVSLALPKYGHFSFVYTPPATGNYTVGVRITRPYTVPTNVSQHVDNFRPATGGAPTGACCRTDGSCVLLSAVGCASINGIYRGDNSPCATANCPQPPTGACCFADGTCSLLTTALCTAQNGTYRGNNTACATANCPQPCPPIVGSIPDAPTTWPSVGGIQTGRLFRDGVADTCALSAPGGAPIAGSFQYQQFDFVNTGGAACVTVDVNTACTGTNFIYAGAYTGGAYDRTNPTLNNVASLGSSPNPTGQMSFNVAAGAAFTIVFAEVTANAGCPSYTFRVSGGQFNCNSGTPCYANCDGSTTPPILNVNDFICFQTKYAAQDPTANCDNSTTPPVLNVNDFICFQTAYAAGCP